MRAAWVIVLVAACGGGGVKDIKDTPPPAPEATCRTAGEKLTDLLIGMQKEPPPDEAVNAQIEKTEKLCTANGWSAAARACFSKIKTVEQADECTKELTTQQLEALAGGKTKDEAESSTTDEEGRGPAPGGTRGPVPKEEKPKGNGTSADPCDGGE